MSFRHNYDELTYSIVHIIGSCEPAFDKKADISAEAIYEKEPDGRRRMNMKNIRFYNAPKYSTEEYKEAAPMIYKTYAANTASENSLWLAQVTDAELLGELKKIEKWEKGTREDLDDELLIGEYEGQKYYVDPEDESDIIYYDENASGGSEIYVTSIVFEPEPELGENDPAEDISQYPLEDILDKFFCYTSDDFEEENAKDPERNYIEFASEDMEDIQSLLTIVGKHVYNKENGEVVDLIIEP